MEIGPRRRTQADELRKRFGSPPQPSTPEDCFDFHNHGLFALLLVGSKFYTYRMQILTPYLRVLTEAAEATRKLANLQLTLDQANEGLVTLLVVPDPRAPSIIEDAAIRRETTVIRPIRSDPIGSKSGPDFPGDQEGGGEGVLWIDVN